MENIEGISQDEFNYLLADHEQLTNFLKSDASRQMLTEKQLEKAVTTMALNLI